MTPLSNPPELTPRLGDGLDRESSASGTHTAHFYSNDAVLVGEIGGRLAATLAAGGAAVVIATPSHRAAFEEQLRAQGLDPVRVAQEGRWLSLDAADTLAAFMVEGWPDTRLFFSQIGGVLDSLRAATGASNQTLVAAYGEMVSLLWEEGETGACMRLEELWNELAQTRRFHLSCGWPLEFFQATPMEWRWGASVQSMIM